MLNFGYRHIQKAFGNEFKLLFGLSMDHSQVSKITGGLESIQRTFCCWLRSLYVSIWNHRLAMMQVTAWVLNKYSEECKRNQDFYQLIQTFTRESGNDSNSAHIFIVR